MELSQFKTVEQLAAAIKSLDMVTSVPWTDYSGTTTIDGWSSTTAKVVLYKKIGKLVFCQFAIQGTSDDTIAFFSLPWNADNISGHGQSFQVLVYGIDDGTSLTAPARLDIDPGSNVFDVYKDLAASAWTNNGTKGIRGEFWYET